MNLIKLTSMKSNTYIVGAAFAILICSSCKKELQDENTNPTQITGDQYDPNLLLTTVQLNYTGSADFQGEN